MGAMSAHAFSMLKFLWHRDETAVDHIVFGSGIGFRLSGSGTAWTAQAEADSSGRAGAPPAGEPE